MNCPYCGTQIPDNATYCGYCNNPIQTAQPQYQQPVAPQPQYQQPQYQQPQYQQPQYQQPQYQQPQYQQPQYQQPVYQQPVAQQPKNAVKKENMLLGILGAAIGSALGGLSIYLFLQMNLIASFSGLITAFCAIKGYELLGGRLSKFGAFICMVIMLVIPWLAHEVYCATEIMNISGVSFSTAFESVAECVDNDIYTENLVTLYLFTLLGGGAMILNAFKTKK